MTYTFIHTVKFAIIAILLFISFISYTHTSHAYFTTSQKEIDLGNGIGLFLIDYKFGMTKHEVILPVRAVNTNEKKADVVEYSILDKDGNIPKGKLSAIVLSHAQLGNDRMYHTKKGSSETFTLAVFFTPDTKSVSEYRLQVTNLPFNWDGLQQLQLNPSELKYYTTKPLNL